MSDETDRNTADHASHNGSGDGRVTVHPVEMPPLEQARGAAAGDGKEQAANLDMILGIPVNISVELGQTHLPIQEILKLGVGSVVELNRLAGQPVDILANGKLIGHGDIVVVDDTLGVRVQRLIGPEQRIKAL
jgi:flagellar motor switch protein FliN